ARGEVEITQQSNVIVKHCKMHHGKGSGVILSEEGLGTIEDCDILQNAINGVEIKQGSDPVIHDCRINRNGYYALVVYQGGLGTVEGCDLRSNTRGPLFVEAGSNVRRNKNRG